MAEPQPHSQQRQLQPQLLSNKIMDVDQHKEGQVALVTGSSGFLGQHLVKLLHEKAPQFKEIRTFDIKPYKQKLGKIVLTWVTFCFLIFLFSHSEASDANIGITVNIGSFEKFLLSGPSDVPAGYIC